MPEADARPACVSRNRRFSVRGDKGLLVEIRPAQGASGSVGGRLLDIAANGANLVLAKPLRGQERIVLRLRHPDLGLDHELGGKTLWSRPRDQDEWLQGLAFETDVPAEVFEKLFEAEILERREFPRASLELAARAKWELDHHLEPVTIQDFSPGGFKLGAPRSSEIGSRLLLVVDRPGLAPLQIPSRVQWKAQAGEVFRLGCQFLREQDYATLCEVLNPSVPADEPPKVSLLRRLVGMLLGRGRSMNGREQGEQRV